MAQESAKIWVPWYQEKEEDEEDEEWRDWLAKKRKDPLNRRELANFCLKLGQFEGINGGQMGEIVAKSPFFRFH